MKRWSVVFAAVIVVAIHLTTLPRTFWEYDEHFFALGVEKYEPLRHHPPPPGAPIYIGFAKVMAHFTGDTFRALVTTSVLCLIAGVVAYALALGAAPAILLYTSPALLMSGVLPLSDSGALAFLGLATWASMRRRPVLCALFCALAVGWRPQVAVAAVVLFAVTTLMTRAWRAIAVFTIACLAWFVPLVISTGGPASFWQWLVGQAAYYARHDADLSRSGYSAAQIVLRFVAHPWGPKWLAFPVLALAVIGLWRHRRSTNAIPLAASCVVYLLFALATMDPADAVRYAIPALPLVAYLGVAPRDERQPGRPHYTILVLVLVYAAGSYWYASPILSTRATRPSPPAAATQWIESHVPKNAVILYDLPLRPHAENALRDYRQMPADVGLAKFGLDPHVPLYVFADGARGDAAGVTFQWPDTDAYRKLTRQHYGAVSVIPIPPNERYRVLEGVFAPERTRDGRAWRWISQQGAIALPDLGAQRVRITFRAPPEYPLERNRITVNGQTVDVARNASASIVVPFARTIVIVPEKSFVPAEIASANNRDRRRLSVMLTRVEQLDMR